MNPHPAGTAPLARNGQTYTRRIPVTVSASVTDEAPQFYQGYPVSIPVAGLRATDPDFNPANCVVVDGEFWLDWRAVPHQVDSWRHGDGAELGFVTDLTPGAARTFYVYYGDGEQTAEYPKLTNAVPENPGYVAWESDAGAFRFYTGQFDFFGKQVQLLPRDERLIYPLIDGITTPSRLGH